MPTNGEKCSQEKHRIFEKMVNYKDFAPVSIRFFLAWNWQAFAHRKSFNYKRLIFRCLHAYSCRCHPFIGLWCAPLTWFFFCHFVQVSQWRCFTSTPSNQPEMEQKSDSENQKNSKIEGARHKQIALTSNLVIRTFFIMKRSEHRKGYLLNWSSLRIIDSAKIDGPRWTFIFDVFGLGIYVRVGHSEFLLFHIYRIR